jgi:putative sugar O-methyltransferase
MKRIMVEIKIATKRELKTFANGSKNCVPCRITNGILLRPNSFINFDLKNVEQKLTNLVISFRNISGNGFVNIKVDNYDQEYIISNSQRIEIPFIESLRISRTSKAIGEISITYLGGFYDSNNSFEEENENKIEKEKVDNNFEDLGFLESTFNIDSREDKILEAQKNAVNKLSSNVLSRMNRGQFIPKNGVIQNKQGDKVRPLNKKLFTNVKDKSVNFNDLKCNSHDISTLDNGEYKLLLFLGGTYWGLREHEMFFTMMKVYDIIVLSSPQFNKKSFDQEVDIGKIINKSFCIICDDSCYNSLTNNYNNYGIESLDKSKILNIKNFNHKDAIDKVLLMARDVNKINVKNVIKKDGDNIVTKKDTYDGDIKFKIVVPSYNSERWIRKTLESIASQKYKNYDVCIVDDKSTDKNQRKIIEEFCKKHNNENNTWKYIFNNKRKGALFNIANAIRNSNCKDEDVIITLDGDDWLYNENVLNRVFKEYKNSDTLLTYGQYISYPGKQSGHCKEYHPRIIKNREYRRDEWRMSHLRTFKYKLFKRIKEEDLIDPRKKVYFEMAWDLALMFPMAEMAGHRIKFISDFLYVYNRENPINDDKVNLNLQARTNGLIRKKKKYPYVDFEKLESKKEDMAVQNNKKLYTKTEREVISKSKDRTSISDNKNYPEFCKLAANDDKIFETFRRAPIYVETLEHVNYNTGLRYVKKFLNNKNPKVMNNMNKYRKNDDYGTPEIKNFGYGVGKLCPTTTRYISVLNDIINIFGDLDSYKIVEVGAGYGGQCKIIHDTYNIENYTIVDLDEAMMLIKKYLSKYNLNPTFESFDSLNEINSDLFISNYAFSECSRDIQNIYLEKLIKNSKNGFMLCNFVSNKFKLNSYSLQELQNKISSYDKKVFVEEEKPNTFAGNKLIYWKNA